MKLTVMSVIFSALLMSTAAHADMRRGKFVGEAVLATAVAQPSEFTTKGVKWNCEGTRCTAVAADWPGLDSFVKQCRIVAAELGTLTQFRAGGRIASKDEVSNCNAAARLAKKQPKLEQEVAKK